jgi:hypothetical protein
LQDFRLIFTTAFKNIYSFHLVVIRDLEEKLFIATKEKENLEDDIQIKNKKVRYLHFYL